MKYREALDLAHRTLEPTSYVEIGCRVGDSLTLARCDSIAIDPAFEIKRPLHAPTRLFRETSDEFFANHCLRELLGGPFELAFVDGLHLAEAVVRDILHLEEHAGRQSVVLVDDAVPSTIEMAQRDRVGKLWTGDVYRGVAALRAHRPDLVIQTFDVDVKGIAVITGFDPEGQWFDRLITDLEDKLAGGAFGVDSVDDIRELMAPRPAEELVSTLEEVCARRRRLKWRFSRSLRFFPRVGLGGRHRH